MNIDQILGDKGSAVVTIDASASLVEATRLLDENRIGATVAIDSAGKVVGVLSERDVVRRLAREGAPALDMKVRDAMTREVITAEPDESVQTCLERMTDRRIRHLPVLRNGALIGIISIGDLVKWKIAQTEAEAEAMKAYIATG